MQLQERAHRTVVYEDLEILDRLEVVRLEEGGLGGREGHQLLDGDGPNLWIDMGDETHQLDAVACHN